MISISLSSGKYPQSSRTRATKQRRSVDLRHIERGKLVGLLARRRFFKDQRLILCEVRA